MKTLATLATLVSVAAFFAMDANAQSSLTYKIWYGAEADFMLPKIRPEKPEYTPTGYPADPSFTKLRDDTGLTCYFIGDFVAMEPGVVAIRIDIDGQRKANRDVGYFNPGWWTAHDMRPTIVDLPAGDYQIRIMLGSVPPVAAQFYARYAQLQCFEHELGIPQSPRK